MPYEIKSECPCCGKIAIGLGDIEALFGWRTPNDKTIPQSYCRKCLSAHCKVGNPCKATE